MKKKPAKSHRNNRRNTEARAILDAFLAQVPFDGCTETAYACTIKQAGMNRTEADRLFPRGIRDVVEMLGSVADEAMQERISAEKGFLRFRTRDKIAFAVRARFGSLTQHREAMRRFMMWYALPNHIPAGLKRLSTTVDLMWRAAGDTSEDFNFYTKRILLAAVLKATTLYWLDDKSPDCQATWAFLDRRIADVLRVGKSISLLKEFSPSEIGDFVRRHMKRN